MAMIDDAYIHKATEIIKAGRFLNSKGWVPATSSNFSMRLDAERIMLTVSGYHKGELSEEALMLVDYQGQALEQNKKPSAETLLHTALYQRYPQVNAVLHTHSVNATVLSRLHKERLVFEDYELLKAFSGITTHESCISVPIFPNDQDIPRLSSKVDTYLDQYPDTHGYLIAGHGLYTWGRDMQETLRHIEAFEFLFECELTMRRIGQS